MGAFLREIARAEPREPKAPPSTPSPGAPDPLLGEVVDEKYRIDAPLGRGGMGTVYRATHLGTGRAVALKVLVPELTANEAAVERFRREARSAGQMRHPNVVDVTDFGFAERSGARLAYLVMELLHGKTLRAVLDDEGRLPLDVAIDVLAQVCSAVAEAHRLGILHRDLKPENIHLEPATRGRYRVKVLDFGIAKLVHEASDSPEDAEALEALRLAPPSPLAATLPATGLATAKTLPVGSGAGSLTRLGAAIGTPRYMSPEQWLGNANDVRTDIYSLGVVAYEMLAGETPFLGKELSIALEHAEVSPPSLAQKAPSVPRRIAIVVEAALAKDPKARPPSAAAFVAALQGRAETTLGLLRRSTALCADHFFLFSRRCALLTVPPLILSAAAIGVGLLAHAGIVSRRVDGVLGACLELGTVLSLFVWAPITGLMVPLVVDLLSTRRAPHPPPTGKELWRTILRAIPSTLASFAIVMVGAAAAWVLANALERLSPLKHHTEAVASALTIATNTVALAPFAVMGAIVVVEGARGMTPLRRSAVLLFPMLRAAIGVQLLFSALTQGLPEIAVLVLGNVTAATPAALTPLDVIRLRGLLLWAVSALLAPFVVVPPALLYLRAREAEGNPVVAE